MKKQIIIDYDEYKDLVRNNITNQIICYIQQANSELGKYVHQNKPTKEISNKNEQLVCKVMVILMKAIDEAKRYE